jgi:hypothetical protein
VKINITQKRFLLQFFILIFVQTVPEQLRQANTGLGHFGALGPAKTNGRPIPVIIGSLLINAGMCGRQMAVRADVGRFVFEPDPSGAAK